MKKDYEVTVDQGFGEDKTIPALIFKNDDGEITHVEVFESNFDNQDQVATFKEILLNDLELENVDLRQIPRAVVE